MTNKTMTAAVTTLIFGLAGQAVYAQSAGTFAAPAAPVGAVPAIEGAAVPQERLDKLINEGDLRTTKHKKYNGKAIVHDGATYVRLPKGLLITLRTMEGAPDTVALINGLDGVEELAVSRIETMIKTGTNVILTVDASGTNNEAMVTEADRQALDNFGARFDADGNVQARGYLRLEGLPVGATLSFIIPGAKPHIYTILVAQPKAAGEAFRKDGENAVENARESVEGE